MKFLLLLTVCFLASCSAPSVVPSPVSSSLSSPLVPNHHAATPDRLGNAGAQVNTRTCPVAGNKPCFIRRRLVRMNMLKAGFNVCTNRRGWQWVGMAVRNITALTITAQANGGNGVHVIAPGARYPHPGQGQAKLDSPATCVKVALAS